MNPTKELLIIKNRQLAISSQHVFCLVPTANCLLQMCRQNIKAIYFIGFCLLFNHLAYSQNKPKSFVISYDNLKSSHVDSTNNGMYLRPDIWWNEVDGLKTGIHVTTFLKAPVHEINTKISL
ncbi:hypothetical protein ACFL6I_25420 [candidate division KSB1 bacterium]